MRYNKNITDNDSLLKLEKVSTGYQLRSNKTRLLHRGIDAKVSSGEFIALLGPNGIGKSTLIKTITGMIPAIDGSVLVEDRNISNLSNRERAMHISVVLTDKIDDGYITALDIATTGRYPHGSFTGKITEDDRIKIWNALEVVKADHLAQRTFITLSDGEKQKILLARAIAQDTPLIILDEPTAFIDSPGKIEVMSLLHHLVETHNKSIIITTHDTEMALNNAHKLWLLGPDQEFYSGDVSDLISKGVVNKVFDREGVVFNKSSLKFEKNNDNVSKKEI